MTIMRDDDRLGYDVAPSHTRKELQDRLGEGYKDGFPILKELLQNADDAGARRLAVLLVEEPPRVEEWTNTGAIPAFLRGPSILVLNDGEFREEHARAIREYRGSDKSGSSTAVGRFGLGLKSVFHWGEGLAHFHLPGAANSSGQQPDNVIIPGAPDFGKAWVRAWQERDPNRLRGWVRGVIKTAHPTWFATERDTLCFWIPLRGESDGKHRLAVELKRDHLAEFREELRGHWDRVWRLLAGAASLIQVEVVLCSGSHTATIEGEPSRLWRKEPAEALKEDAAAVSMDLLVDGRRMIVRGWQTAVGDLVSVRGGAGWPVRDARNEDEEAAPLEVPATAAAFVIGPASLGDGTRAASVAVDWACWFPLTGDNRESHAEVRAVLHSAFLVDSTRKGFSVEAPWNRELALQGAAPNLPRALESYLREASHPDANEPGTLTAGVRQGLLGLTNPTPKQLVGLEDAIGSQFVWGPFVDPSANVGWCYQCVPASTRVLGLPVKKDADGRRFLDRLPGLGSLASQAGLAVYWGHESPTRHLGPLFGCAWRDEDVEVLFKNAALDALDVCADAFAALGEPLRRLTAESSARRIIEAFVRRAVDQGASGAEIESLVRCLPTPWILRLPRGMDPGLARHLVIGYEGQLLMPWVQTQTSAGQSPWTGRPAQPGEILRLALEWYDRQPDDSRRLDDGMVPLARWLRDGRSDRSTVGSEFAGAIPVHVFASIGGVDTTPRIGRDGVHIFRRKTEDGGRSTTDLGPKLATASKWPVAIVEGPIAELAGWSDLEEWSLAAVVSLVAATAFRMHDAPENRRQLVRALERELEDGRDPKLRTALRRLVTGLQGIPQDQPILQAKGDGGGETGRALREIAGALDALVPAPLAECLSQNASRVLGIAELTAEGLIWFIRRADPTILQHLPFDKLPASEAGSVMVGLAAEAGAEAHIRALPIHQRAGSRERSPGEPLPPTAVLAAAEAKIARLLPDELDGRQVFVRRPGKAGDVQERVCGGPADLGLVVDWTFSRADRMAENDRRQLLFWALESAGDTCLTQRSDVQEADWLADADGRPLSPISVIDVGDEDSKPLAKALHDHPARPLLRRPAEQDLKRGRDLNLWPQHIPAVGRLVQLAELPPLGPLASVPWPEWSGGVADRPIDSVLSFLKALSRVEEAWVPAALDRLSGDVRPERAAELLRELTAEVDHGGRQANSTDGAAPEAVLIHLLPLLQGREHRALLRGIRLPSRAGAWGLAEELTWNDQRGVVEDEVTVDDPVAQNLLRLDAADFEIGRAGNERETTLEAIFASVGGDDRIPQLVGLLALVLGHDELATRELKRAGYDVDGLRRLFVEKARSAADDVRQRALQALSTSLQRGKTVQDSRQARSFARILAPLAQQSQLLTISHLLTETCIERVLAGGRPGRQDIHEAMGRLLGVGKSQFGFRTFEGRVRVYERLQSGAAHLSLCGEPLPPRADPGSAQSRRQSVVAGFELAQARIVLHAPPAGLPTDAVAQMMRVTILDAAERWYGTRLEEVEGAAATIIDSGPRYVRHVRKLLLGNPIHWTKVSVDEIRCLAGELLEAGSRHGTGDTRPLGNLVEKHSWDLARALGQSMRNHGYTEESVLFELLQNSDDAVIQRREELGLPAGTMCYIDVSDDRHLDFVHWGRQIGETHAVGGKLGRGAWASDLVYMLDTMASGKGGGQEGRETGMFGLGFKSVYAITDAPIIAGGRFPPFVIDGGCLPRILDDRATDAVSVLRVVEERRVDGLPPPTVFRLPYRDSSRPSIARNDENKVQARFERLIRYALIFTRGLTRIEIRRRGGVQPYEQRLSPVPGLVGLRVVEGLPERRRGLVFGADPATRALLLVNDHGVDVPHPDEALPTLWTTAPTKVELRLPLLLNGRWALEPGRTSIRREASAQEVAVQGLQEALGDGLDTLARQHQATWPTLRAQLKLPSSMGFPAFIAGLWKAIRLTTTWENEPDGSAERTVAAIFWSDEPAGTGALRRLASAGGLPDSLIDPQAVLGPEKVTAIRAGELRNRAVFEKLSVFHRQRLEASVDESVGVFLRMLDDRERDTQTLAGVIKQVLSGSGQCGRDSADVLGRCGVGWRTEEADASEDLREAWRRIPELLFQDARGSWLNARTFDLLGLELSSSYSEAGRDFFAVCKAQAKVRQAQDAARRVPEPVMPVQPIEVITQQEYLRALAVCWQRRSDLQKNADGLDGLYSAVALERRTLPESLATPKHPGFEETWFRLLCGVSIQAALGNWDRHIKYLENLRREDHLGRIWRGETASVLETTTIPWTADPDSGDDWTMHHRFLVDFGKFRALVQDHDYAHRLLKAAQDPERSRHFCGLAYGGHEPDTGRRMFAARASLKHFAALIARELWRLEVARNDGLGDIAFFLSRHAFKTCEIFGLVTVEKNPAALEQRLEQVEDIVKAIRNHPKPAVSKTLDRWRDAPFLTFSKDPTFKKSVLDEIRREKPIDLEPERSDAIDRVFDRMDGGEVQ